MLLRRFTLVAILLVATALRVIGLDNFPTPLGASPPGLEHDEVAHWLINRDILAGEHAIYFSEAYGHEALYHYAQAFFGAAVGDHALALRLPSAYLGVLLVAVSYALGRRLFGVRMGLLSAAFLAVLFWPVFYSRLALRAVALPMVAGLSAVVWWRAFAGERGSRGAGEMVSDGSPLPPRSLAPLLFLSGALAGLSLHTYMAARAVPIFYALYCAYLAVFHRAAFRARWRGIVAFWLALAAVALPLVAFLLLNPGAEARIGEVDAPLRALLAGDPRPVLLNAAQIAGGFGLRGDPLWRQGIAGRPVFDPVLGVLFYGGLLLCLWRWREPRHAFLLLWLGASVIPSLVTVDAPSTIRMINALPVLMLFPLLAGQAMVRSLRGFGKAPYNESVKPNTARLIHFCPQLSTLWTRLSTDLITAITGGALVLLFLYHAWATVDGLWRIWPANDEVQFVWQAALTEAAREERGQPQVGRAGQLHQQPLQCRWQSRRAAASRSGTSPDRWKTAPRAAHAPPARPDSRRSGAGAARPSPVPCRGRAGRTSWNSPVASGRDGCRRGASPSGSRSRRGSRCRARAAPTRPASAHPAATSRARRAHRRRAA
jgi:4-amino-4-deoxy-L-arabinose transferase-like glycosyltransferase